MDQHAAITQPEQLLFIATIRPHRSLSRRGILTLIGFMLACSAAVTSLMALLGAWPVIGFNGADILLALFLLHLNIRAAHTNEIITLTDTELRITSTDLHGRHNTLTLPPYWLRITLSERAGTVPKLHLTTRNTAHEIARALGETQKRDLATALTRALHKWHHRSYDNPQLRD